MILLVAGVVGVVGFAGIAPEGHPGRRQAGCRLLVQDLPEKRRCLRLSGAGAGFGGVAGSDRPARGIGMRALVERMEQAQAVIVFGDQLRDRQVQRA